MPTKNVVKQYVEESYYHLYTRGVNKQPIFLDEADKSFFLELLKRYLSSEQSKRPKHTFYKSFYDSIDLLAYCLMENHVHLLLYQKHDSSAIAQLMRRVMTTYSMYFNKKYNRAGPLFQSRYLASRVGDDAYLHHISRYIHRNPRYWSEYPYSSLRYYLGKAHAEWIKPSRIMELFDNNIEKYTSFLREMDNDDEETIVDLLAHR